MFCLKCGRYFSDGQVFCPQCGSSTSQTDGRLPAVHPQDLTLQPLVFCRTRPMKWFKFLIWFSLFFSVADNGLGGLNILLNCMKYAHLRWSQPALWIFDLSNGLFLIGFAVFILYVRMRLAHFRKNGPALFLSLYVISLVYYILTAFLPPLLSNYFITDIPALGLAVFVNTLTIVLNKIYFDKRKFMFVN